MSKTSAGSRTRRAGAGVSRRKFLARTVTTGSAALIGATAAAAAAAGEGHASAQDSKPTVGR